MHSIQGHLCQHREKLQLKTASLHRLKTDLMQIMCFSHLYTSKSPVTGGNNI